MSIRLQIILTGFWIIFGAIIWSQAQEKAKTGCAIFFGFFAVITFFAFVLRRSGMRRTIARVKSELTDIANKDLDAASTLSEHQAGEFVESLASNPSIARMMARSGIRYFVSGTWKEAPVEFGTNIVPGRDNDMRESYVCAGPPSSLPKFRAITRGTLTTMSRIGMETHEVKLGDPAFDAKWIVDGDETLVRNVLDDAGREALMQLFGKLTWNQAHTASVESVGRGVVIRWPGELTAAHAAFLRDLAFSVRAKLTSA
jgi:hypothetical protein